MKIHLIYPSFFPQRYVYGVCLTAGDVPPVPAGYPNACQTHRACLLTHFLHVGQFRQTHKPCGRLLLLSCLLMLQGCENLLQRFQSSGPDVWKEEATVSRWELGRGDEERGSQLDSFFYLQLPFAYLWKLPAEAGPRIFSFLSIVCFPEENRRTMGQELYNQIVAKTIVSSHSIVSFQWYENPHTPSQSAGFFYLTQSPSCTPAALTEPDSW